MVATALASPVCVSASTLDDADPVPPRHGVAHALVIIRLAAPVSVGAPGSPSSSLPPAAALVGLVEQTPLAISDDELCSPSDLDDDRLSSEVLLHIAYEVVSQLDRAEDFWLLSPDKQDLCDFLEDHITSLQLVVEVASLQDTAAPLWFQTPSFWFKTQAPHSSVLRRLCSGVSTQFFQFVLC
jgi:hypothetical protein